MSDNYKGIDYGMGQTNIDKKTGIRYGVIGLNDCIDFTLAWDDSSEPNWSVYCPYCGAYLRKGFDAKRCPECYKRFEEGDFDMIEPDGYYLDDGEYLATQSQDDQDVFIIKSPYYTLCQYCSPCAPGAGYIMNTVEDGVKAYCFGHDWFEGGKAPYPVYDVKTNKLMEA